MATTLDDLTAGAIQRALAAAAAGRLAEACSIGERALIEGGDVAALNAMIGMFRLRAGDEARAVDHLRLAHAARPGDVRVAANLASALMQQGRNEEALLVASEELANSDATLQLLRLRGFSAQTTENFDVAVDAYQQIVAANPLGWESWNSLGNARRGAGDFDGSVSALTRAVEINPASPPVQLRPAPPLGAAGGLDGPDPQFPSMRSAF